MDNKKKVEQITSMDVDFAQWYTDVVKKAELIEYTSVKGCMAIRPYGYAIWENIQSILDGMFKATGHENVCMPMFIPESLLNKEKDHVEGFAPEVAWITHGGSQPLEERLCVRPTSETLFCEHYANIIQSWRDLPKLYNQWVNVVRWEKTTRPFLRSREFLWQEGHTIHATSEEAIAETEQMLNIYADFCESVLAMPVIKGKKTESDKFAGAEAEPIKLTKEQEQLALKTALVSGLPWCAVDIMPLVKGSNKELGDNVILEINASPGTAGISEVLKFNFVNILLNELTDPSSFYIQEKIAGYRERVTIDFGSGNTKNFLAKLDTGNSTKATCLEVGDYTETDTHLTFEIDGKSYTYEKIAESNAKSGKDIHNRPIIILPQLTLAERKLNNVPVSVVKERDRLTNVLINRDTMSKLGLVVNPAKTHILTDSIKKVKI